jgi:integrase
MGHGSKKMVYEVYGDYIEGLEEDIWQILDYFGRDFVEPKRKPAANVLAFPGQQMMVPSSIFPLPTAVNESPDSP